MEMVLTRAIAQCAVSSFEIHKFSGNNQLIFNFQAVQLYEEESYRNLYQRNLCNMPKTFVFKHLTPKQLL